MAVRVPPTLTPPPEYANALYACMAAKPLQHQDELTLLLYWMDTLLPPVMPLKVIVEIGSHRGGTLELWARLATKMVVAIDLPEGVGGGLSFDAMCSRNEGLFDRFGNVWGICGDSHALETRELLERRLGDNPIDLLFIDGDHTYEGVEADYHDYSDFVRPGGVIAFHDVTCSEDRSLREHLGVNQFFAQLDVPDKRIFSVGWEWGGIGVIRR